MQGEWAHPQYEYANQLMIFTLLILWEKWGVVRIMDITKPRKQLGKT